MRVLRPVLICVAIAAVVRIGLILVLGVLTHHKEVSDDALYYREMRIHPFSLFTGTHAADLKSAGIYSPLVPIEVAYPANALIPVFGEAAGHRLGMMAWELPAVAITAWLLISTIGMRPGWRNWVALFLVSNMPGDVLATCIWGQEDSCAALFAALALACFLRGRSDLGTAITGLGLITTKIFAVIPMFAVWCVSGKAIWRTTSILVGTVALFALVIAFRRYHSGFLFPHYEYEAITNSPSPWAALGLSGVPIKFESIRLFSLALTGGLMVLFGAIAFVRKLDVVRSIVALQFVFYATFIGIQPEHYQWILPFIMYLVWWEWQRGSIVLGTMLWSAAAIAYTYKIVYGLANSVRGSSDASSKADLAARLAHLLHLNFAQIQLVLAYIVPLMVLATAVWIVAAKRPRTAH